MVGPHASTAPLPDGAVVHLVGSGAQCRVLRSLGRGGQGEVFAAEAVGFGLDGSYALKWYHRVSATPAQRTALQGLIDAGRPHERFLWPIDLAETAGHPSFGYLMPLRPTVYRGIVDLVSGKEGWSARTIATVGYELADSFSQLHSKGLCYRDISFGNAFYRPDTGAVLICDNDNVALDGSAEGQVLGTPYFMAPEVVRGDALPSAQTDLYSLAVLLFYLLVRHHPLLGARELEYPSLDHRALEQLFGHHATFIFDPSDETNRPLPDVHDPPLVLWPMLPSFVQRRFVEAFTVGLHDPWRRVGDIMWKRVMLRLRDAIFACGTCGAENFADLPRAAPAAGVDSLRCWSCGTLARPRYVLYLDGADGAAAVALTPEVQLFGHHLTRSSYDFRRGLATVTTNPRDPAIWGLTNRTDATWTATTADGESHDVTPGRTVRLEPGLRIAFGAANGVIAG
jgi:DNA-binding helix-hairpin-helix protein with protein kinase domain